MMRLKFLENIAKDVRAGPEPCSSQMRLKFLENIAKEVRAGPEPCGSLMHVFVPSR